MIRNIALTLLLIIMTVSGAAAERVDARKFGILPDTYRSMTDGMIAAMEYCKSHPGTTLVFEPGRYDIWPEGAVRKEVYVSNTSSESECSSKIKCFGIFLDSLENVVFDGNGATFMMHGDITPVAVRHCKNIKLTRFEVDFERPGGSELTYTSVKPGCVEMSVHRDTRYEIRNGRINLIGEGWRSNIIHCIKYTPDNRHFVYSGDWQVLEKSPVKELSPGLLRFETPADFKPEIGATLTLRDIIRRQTGMLLLENNGVELTDINVRYMHGLGIVSQFSRDITMRRVNCKPSDTSGRLLASSADFMHFSGCSGHITVEDCNFAGAHDDFINVHGTNLRIMSHDGDSTLTARFMHHQSYGFDAFHDGDTVAFVNPKTMRRETTAVVKSVERIDPRNVRVSFTDKLPQNIVTGSTCIENMTCTPSLTVSGCHFTRNSTRGILCTTPRKVVIENNLFERTGMSAILIEGDAEGWFESGPVTDVTIRNNRFIGCAYSGGPERAAIALNPSNSIVNKSQPVHTNILIENNFFDTEGRPVLFAKSTSDIRFIHNTVTGDSAPVFILTGCDKVKIGKDNHMPKPVITNR